MRPRPRPRGAYNYIQNKFTTIPALRLVCLPLLHSYTRVSPTLHRASHQAGRPARGGLGGGCDDAARGAAAECGVRDPALDEGLELGAEVGHVEGVFADDRGRGVGGLAAVPAEAVCGPAAGVSRGTESGEGRGRTCCVCGADALDDEPDGVCEADGVVRGVGWTTRGCMSMSAGVSRLGESAGGSRTGEEEHLALCDVDVFECVAVDDAQEHRAPVLVEPLLQHTPSISVIPIVMIVRVPRAPQTRTRRTRSPVRPKTDARPDSDGSKRGDQRARARLRHDAPRSR